MGVHILYTNIFMYDHHSACSMNLCDSNVTRILATFENLLFDSRLTKRVAESRVIKKCLKCMYRSFSLSLCGAITKSEAPYNQSCVTTGHIKLDEALKPEHLIGSMISFNDRIRCNPVWDIF